MDHARNHPSSSADSDPYSSRSSEFSFEDDYDAGSLTRQLAETAVGVREMSKQLGRTRVHSHIHTVLIVTKARDNRLIELTRELALYLMRKPTHSGRGIAVYVDAQLKTSRRFDAAGIQRDHPEFFVPFPRAANQTRATPRARRTRRARRAGTARRTRRSPHLFDFVVTLGGDGTVLFTSWLFQRIVPPVLPFALGSLGFLTNFDFADYAAVMDGVLDNGIRVNLRMRFTCTVYRAVKPEDERTRRRAVKKGDTGEILMKNLEKGGWEALESGCPSVHDTGATGKKDKEIMCFTTRPVESFEVLNDLVVDRGPSPYVSLLELFGDEHHLTTVQADGLTISTPTGSTAYSLSAGGSLVHPEIPSILITPICPHTLSFRPMLLPDSMELRICVPFNSRSTAWASFDGRGRVELKQGDHIKVTASKYPFPTVCADTQSTDWFNSISRTLKWNERERQKSFVVVEEGPARKKDKKRRLSEASSENGQPVNGDHPEGEVDEPEDEKDEEDEEDEDDDEEDEKFDIDDLSSTESSPPHVVTKLEENLLQPEEAKIGKEKVIEQANGGDREKGNVQAQAEDVARLLTAHNPFLQIPHTRSGVQSGIETPDRFTGPHPHPPRVSPRHVQFAQSNESSSGSLASLDPRNGAAAVTPAPPFRRELREEGGRSQTRRTGTSRSRTPRTRDPELEAQKTPRGLDEAATGDTDYKKIQQRFLDMHQSDMHQSDSRISGIRCITHLALGDTDSCARSEQATTRTLLVLGSGALTMPGNSTAVPILGGVTGINADEAFTGAEPECTQKYNPQGYFNMINEFTSDWRGGVFDVVAIAVGDTVFGTNGSVAKATHKTMKIFRIEGESIFLTEQGMDRHGANNRIFPGLGGSVIECPNVLQLLAPPQKEDDRVEYRRPAVCYLSVGHSSSEDPPHTHKLLNYDEATEELRNIDTPQSASESYPAAVKFKIKSLRVLTNDSRTSFQCHERVYTPLVQKTIPDAYDEMRPAWLAHMPTCLAALMRDNQITFGHVRSFVIPTSRSSKRFLRPNLAQNITDQELRRLEHGPVSLSALSTEGINSINVVQEPVQRLLQSREAKCGRKVLGDVDHGWHMEYLAEFSNGSTFWTPSYNVAQDLKEEFWNIMTMGAKEVAEIVSLDLPNRKVTVKRPDGSTEIVGQTQVFWQEEPVPTRLTDTELEGLLYHEHFGLNFDGLMPCTYTVNTDWGRVEILHSGAAFIKDPAADKDGEYADIQWGERSIFIGRTWSMKFRSRSIPLFISHNGAAYDIQGTHGSDAKFDLDKKGNAILSFPGQEHFESHVDPAKDIYNTSIFHIRETDTNVMSQIPFLSIVLSTGPIIVTPGLLCIETNWAAIDITSKDARVVPDPTVDQSIYTNVTFTDTSVGLVADVFGQKFVIPFLFVTRDESIDITITHGRDHSHHEDKLGCASALFAQQKTYGSWSRESPKSFTGCRVNKRPPAARLEVA
ncbi:hypothetical protein EVJ58_g10401 [Rhodofomes roseus]|uniref:ATP-NAD kinase n=1 Tax=Rhodofomes roseus TaxID=34475 RepID=A0A4Y9XRD7_9APHY|nr:hypothetical protein EVJ58_g10401 [Rhodofomes roseus]